MTRLHTLLAATAAVISLALPAVAGEGIVIDDPYARTSGATATSGAIFMTIMNHAAEDDRLLAATTDAATRAELHTHIEDANGVMKMTEVEGGFPVAAKGSHMLDRGGDHVMLLGLTRPLAQGDTLALTLTFENAGDVTVDVPVDNGRKPSAAMGHGTMDHTPAP